MLYVENIDTAREDGKIYGVRDTSDNTLDYVTKDVFMRVAEKTPIFGIKEDGSIDAMTPKKIYNFIQKYKILPDWIKEIGFAQNMIHLKSVHNNLVPKVCVIPQCIQVIDEDAFNCVDVMEEVILGVDVKIVSKDAFYRCENLRKVTLNNNLEYMSSGFRFCNNITEIVVPTDKKFIPTLKIEVIHFPNLDVSKIKEGTNLSIYSFEASKIKSFTAPKGSYNLSANTFRNCPELEFVDLSQMNDLISLPLNCFNSCKNLKKVILPDSVTEFSYGTFYYCSELEEIVTNNKNFTISATNVFYGCTKLNFDKDWVFKIVSDNVYNNTSFLGCDNLTHLHIITNNLSNFTSVPNLEVLTVDVDVDNRTNDNSNIPPDTLVIQNNCFKGLKKLRKINGNLPKNILVGNSAFEMCESFSDNEFVSKITSFTHIDYRGFDIGKSNRDYIEGGHFIKTALTDITLNPNITYIPDNCFLNSSLLSNVRFTTQELPEIELTAFLGTKITFEQYPEFNQRFTDFKKFKAKLILTAQGMDIKQEKDRVVLIGINKANGETLRIPKGVTHIDIAGNISREVYSQIKEVIVPDTVVSIKGLDLPFAKDMTIPESVEDVDRKTLQHFNHIELPPKIKELPSNFFSRAYGIRTIILNEGIEKLGNFCFHQSGLVGIYLPNSLKEIGVSCFEECSDLTYVIFPLDLKTIPRDCCYRCRNLEWVVVGKDTVIEERAFKKAVNIIRVDREELYREGSIDDDIEFDD